MRRKPKAAIPKSAIPSDARRICQPSSCSAASGSSSGGISKSETAAQTRTLATTIADEHRRGSQDAVRAVPFQLDRGTGREGAREQQPDRCRELEARVLSEENSRRRERMQPEEAGAHDARERDEKETGVAPAPRRGRHAPAERGRDRCSAEHDPEVRRMVLPVLVERGPREEEREEGERRNRDRDPVSRAHPVQGIASRVYSHAP